MAEPTLIEVSLEMVTAGAREFKTRHGDTCYPMAYESEAEAAAIAIYGAMERARKPTAASTLEDQARLIGECREGFQEARQYVDAWASASGTFYRGDAQDALAVIDALLTKLNAFGEQK